MIVDLTTHSPVTIPPTVLDREEVTEEGENTEDPKDTEGAGNHLEDIELMLAEGEEEDELLLPQAAAVVLIVLKGRLVPPQRSKRKTTAAPALEMLVLLDTV